MHSIPFHASIFIPCLKSCLNSILLQVQIHAVLLTCMCVISVLGAKCMYCAGILKNLCILHAIAHPEFSTHVLGPDNSLACVPFHAGVHVGATHKYSDYACKVEQS